MSQTAALLTDSLRHLRSRYLFWISIALSALGALALFGTYSFTPEGIRFLWMRPWENPTLASGTDGPRQMVAGVFNGFFVRFWLSWGVLILALVSTASVLPDFLRSGAIDTALAKPISRIKLFLVKVFGSLLFVMIQVAVGVVLAYLLIGIRFGMWIPESLLAIPLITLQFFYLYCFAALIAVLTRSTLASLIGTMLIWFAIFIVQFVTNQFQENIASIQAQGEVFRTRVAQTQQLAADEGRELNNFEQFRIEQYQKRIEESDKAVNGWPGTWNTRLQRLELVVPKTGDIKKILANKVKAPMGSEMMSLFFDLNSDEFRPSNIDEDEWSAQLEAGAAGESAVRNVDTWVSIGSSLAVSGLALAFATLIFRRRDF